MKNLIEAGHLVLLENEATGDPVILEGRARALLQGSLRRLETQEDAKRVAKAVEHHALLVSHVWFDHRLDCSACLLGQDCLQDAKLRAYTELWRDRMHAIREELQ